MSYETLHDKPHAMGISIHGDELEIVFQCERCGEYTRFNISPYNLLFYGFEVECANARCRKPDERPGYSLEMVVSWRASYLGLNDRPLHPVCGPTPVAGDGAEAGAGDVEGETRAA